MRPSLRRDLADDHADDHAAAAEAGHHGGLGADLHRVDPRGGRLDPADLGPHQGDRAGDH